jgi:hypothetical protein
MLRPKPILKPKQMHTPLQANPNNPQLEIRIQSTTTRDSVTSTRDGNITQEVAQRMISKTPVS